MSVLGLMENTENIAQTTPDLSALPSTNPERFGAAWDAAQTPDRYWNVQAARRQGAAKIIDDLHAQTGERLLNPYDNSPTQDEIRENLGQPTTVIYAKRLEKLRNATRNARAGMEQFGGLPQDYLDVDSIDAKIAQQSGEARAHDESLTGTGGGLGAFAGSMAGETVSPHGILSSFIPVTRMSTGIAEATVAAFAKNVAKEAAFQGGTQAAAQGMATLIDYNTRKPFGTEQSTGEIVDGIVSAFAGGALLGGSLRAVHLGILKLASRGVEIPPAVLDSARVMEERDLYGDRNPLRINPGQNEVATDQATSAAALGRAASPDIPPAVADTARASHPDLMLRHDALTQTIDDIRALLNPTDETITHLRAQADEITERIKTAGPQTAEQAARLGGVARAREIELQEAITRQAALAKGEGVETPYTSSLRQQLLDAQDDLRALSPQMREALGPDIMTRLAEERARRPAEAAAAGGETPRQHRPDFYEWQKTNKLAGENGQPVMGYHGTTRAFETFDPAMQGKGAGLGKGEEGFFFGGTPEMANEFAGKLGEGYVQGGQVRPAYLRMENPKIITDTGGDVRTVNFGKEIAAARAEGHDGLVIRNTVEGGDVKGDSYVVFDAKNIKNFDERYAVPDELQRLTKSIEEHPDNPMQAPRPAPPEPAARPAEPKPSGESPQDRAVLQQAQQVLDSETLTKIDPAASSKMAAIDMEMQQAKAAVGCLAGAI